MPPVSVLIKPVSSECNLNCSYCFYRDIAGKREKSFMGRMSAEDAEKIIVSALDFATESCSFMFQGGEPTLAGIDFYKKFTELERIHQKPNVKIFNSIQTNGTLIDDEWAQFLAAENFLIGLSLDGMPDIHDLNRVTKAGNGTYKSVIRAADALDKYNAAYNILCVVTGKTARSAQKVYNFFKTHGFRYLQFIPCLEPLGTDKAADKFAPSADAYGDFLIKIFNLWFEDLKRGCYISIRNIDNYINMLLGGAPEACSMCGRCGIQFVTEGDLSVYPCDFYVLDEWKLGNINTDSFEEMCNSQTALKFVTQSTEIPQECGKCRYYPLCRNGCRRDRAASGETAGLNLYCKAYKKFFSENERRLNEAANIIIRMKQSGK